MEGSAAAMVTWRMEKNVTVERKRFVCCVLLNVEVYIYIYIYSLYVFLPGIKTLHSATLFLQECTSPCCNANNCTLKAGAECAHGICCHDCKVLTLSSKQRETQISCLP